ncbi:MAG: hypothetical protein H0X24_01205 [Ktedonobacterales bacterium]|nr:hypothetical protein [Ktedonobacterales bacterium]
MARKRRGYQNMPKHLVAEGPQLPAIWSESGFIASVNAYIIGTEPCPDKEAPLFYLSLVSKSGQRPRAVTAYLMANATRSKSNANHLNYGNATLSDLHGKVALAHYSPSLTREQLGYNLHWRTRAHHVGNGLQMILESDLLTCFDPAQLDQPPPMTLDEWGAFRRQPVFVLLRWHSDDADPPALAYRYLRYLAKRVPPLPAVAEWAPFLWSRAVARGDVTPLTAWCFDPSTQVDEYDSFAPLAHTLGPVFTGAYLCRPDLPRVQEDLRDGLRSGWRSEEGQ